MAINQARFTIQGTPSEDSNGDRLYVALHSENLVITLEQNPSPALSARFEVFDAADDTSPVASKDAPLLTWTESGLPAVTIGKVPFGIDDDVNLVMPATQVAPLPDVHSYRVRCTVSTPGDGSPGSQEQVFERQVMIFGLLTTPSLRKTTVGETTEARARAWSDSLNDLVEAVNNIAVGGGGSLNTAYILGNTIAPTAANGPLQFNGQVSENTSPLDVTMDATSVILVDGAGAVDITPTSGESLTLAALGAGLIDMSTDTGDILVASGADVDIDAVGDILIGTTTSTNIVSGIGNSDPLTRWTHGGDFAIDNEAPKFILVNEIFDDEEAKRWVIEAQAPDAPNRLIIAAANASESPTGLVLTAERLDDTSTDVDRTTIYGAQIHLQSSNSTDGETPTVLIQPSGTGGTGDLAELLTLSSNGGASNGVSAQHVGARDPNGNVTGSPGDVYWRTDDGTSSTAYMHTGAATSNSDWAEFGPGGGVSELQGAYDGGNDIVATAARSIDFSNSVDLTDLLTLTRTFAGAGRALNVTMGATATGDAVHVTHNNTSGALLKLTSTFGDMLDIDADGTLALNALDGGDFSALAEGTGVVVLATVGSGEVTVTADGTGEVVVEAQANNVRINAESVGEVQIGVAGGNQQVIDVNGAVTFAPTSGQDFDVITAGAGEAAINAWVFPTSAVVFTAPIVDGTDGDVLTTDGLGNLSFSDPGLEVSLQEAYVTGNEIAVTTAEDTVLMGNAADVTDVLTLSRTFAGAGRSLRIDHATGTTGIAAHITVDLGSDSTALQIDQDGGGAALLVNGIGASVISLDAVGDVIIDSDVDQQVFITSNGTGDATFAAQGSGDARILAAAGDCLVDALAGSVNIEAQSVGDVNLLTDSTIRLTVSQAGAVSVTPESALDFIVTTTGGGILDFNGPVEISDATAIDALAINKSGAVAGSGLSVTMQTTTTGDALSIESVAGSTGAGLVINQDGSGIVTQMDQGGATRFLIDASGGMLASAASNQNATYQTDGTGILHLRTQGSGNAILEALGTGNVVVDANAGAVRLEQNGVPRIVVDAAGAIDLTSADGEDIFIVGGLDSEVFVQAFGTGDVAVTAEGTGDVDIISAGGDVFIDAAAGELNLEDIGESGLTLSQTDAGAVINRVLVETGAGEVLNGVTSIVAALNRLAERAIPIQDIQGGQASTDGTGFVTKVSITLPANTEHVVSSAMTVWHSNTNVQSVVRVQNVTLGGNAQEPWVTESKDTDDRRSVGGYVRITTAGSAQTLELQYARNAGSSGTVTTRDGALVATRVD